MKLGKPINDKEIFNNIEFVYGVESWRNILNMYASYHIKHICKLIMSKKIALAICLQISRPIGNLTNNT